MNTLPCAIQHTYTGSIFDTLGQHFNLKFALCSQFIRLYIIIYNIPRRAYELLKDEQVPQQLGTKLLARGHG